VCVHVCEIWASVWKRLYHTLKAKPLLARLRPRPAPILYHRLYIHFYMGNQSKSNGLFWFYFSVTPEFYQFHFFLGGSFFNFFFKLKMVDLCLSFDLFLIFFIELYVPNPPTHPPHVKVTPLPSLPPKLFLQHNQNQFPRVFIFLCSDRIYTFFLCIKFFYFLFY
jgi:hypothetical protein